MSLVGGISNSFFHEFDFLFRETLKDRGSRLLQFTTIEPIFGESKTFRQLDVGPARREGNEGEASQHMDVNYDARICRPKGIIGSIMLDDFSSMRQGNPPVEQLAAQAADQCGLIIDQYIIEGITGDAKGLEKTYKLPESQTIAWDNKDLLPEIDPGSEYSNWTLKGMNVSKLMKGKQMLRSAHVNRNSPIICLLSEWALAGFIADPMVKNTLMNKQGPAMSQGEVMEYGGVLLIPFEQVERVNAEKGVADASYREFAYMYAIEQIITGEKPLFMKMGQNAERNLNDVLVYKGMYDTVRMQEKAVVKIQLAGPNGA